MDKAYVCPKCKAQLVLDNSSEKICAFCSTKLSDENSIPNLDWGFYTPGFARSALCKSYVCKDCGRIQYALFDESYAPKQCVYCAGEHVEDDSAKTKSLPQPIRTVAFRYTRSDASEAYTKAIKHEKFKFAFFGSADYVKRITPIYIPAFLFDYHVFANTVLSVVPIVKAPRQTGERVFSALVTTDDITFERTDSTIQPYAKDVSMEMIWQNVPILASSLVPREVYDKISPFVVKNHMSDGEVSDMKDASILDVDRTSDQVFDDLTDHVRPWVEECVIAENLAHYQISSFVDQTKYEKGFGQMIYLPMWQMTFKKKNQTYAWYMNAISGESSDIVELKSEEAVEKQPEDSLAKISKKRIRNFKSSDIAHPEYDMNYRTYMVDTVASSISLETTLNEAAMDKSLYHLERGTMKNKIEVTIPDSEAFQSEAAEEVQMSRGVAIPSSPVPLPEVHSELFMMKEEIQNRTLGRGKKLPEKPLDRKVGNEAEFDNRNDTTESLAVEFGLSDLPEYDPSGPNPFKKI